MTRPILRRVVVPVASETDARATAAALPPYVDEETETVLAVHVIEKAGGAPDKASVEQLEDAATNAFDAFTAALAFEAVQTEIRYGTDVALSVLDAAHEHDATAIAFTPRGGSRWVKLLTGDVTTELLDESDVPVVVLPDVEDER